MGIDRYAGAQSHAVARRSALALAVGVGLLVVGCGSQEETAAVPDPADFVAEAREAAQAARESMTLRRDALRREAETKLARLEAELDALAESASEAGADSIDALERQAGEVRARLERLDDVTRDRLDRFGTELAEALGELEQGIREVTAELRS